MTLLLREDLIEHSSLITQSPIFGLFMNLINTLRSYLGTLIRTQCIFLLRYISKVVNYDFRTFKICDKKRS